MIEPFGERLYPPRVRWVCRADCPECGGFAWVDDWVIQDAVLCVNAQPEPRWARAALVAMKALDAVTWRARVAWWRRPSWLRRWWWTGEMPF